MPQIDDNARAMAAQCRHYAMWKIDYLGTGLCPSGPDKGFVSARMARSKHVLAFLVYLPGDRVDLVREVLGGFAGIAAEHGLEHDFGFLTPLDLGRRAILEYDYYLDHADPGERGKAARALPALDAWLEEMTRRVPGFVSMKDVFGQGFSRKESFLYRV